LMESLLPLERKLVGLKEDGELTIFSYNILSDGSAKPNYFPKVNPNLLLWNNRRDKIIQQIISQDADIVCLQEVDHFRDYFLPTLGKLGYEGIYKQRTAKKDGCCIFFKRDKFYMLQEYCVDFNDIAEKLKDKTNAHLMLTSNVAIIVFLQTVNSERVFCLANCHLWWEPSAGLIREYQLQYLLMKIKEAKEQLAFKSSDTPTFICGDLNEELNKFSKLNEIFTKIGYLSSYSTFFSQREQENEKRRKQEIKQRI